MWLLNPPEPSGNEYRRWLAGDLDDAFDVPSPALVSDLGTGDAEFVVDSYTVSVTQSTDDIQEVIEYPGADGTWVLRRDLTPDAGHGLPLSIHPRLNAEHPANRRQRNQHEFRTEPQAYALWAAPSSYDDPVSGTDLAWRMAFNPPFDGLQATLGRSFDWHRGAWILWFGPSPNRAPTEERIAFPMWVNFLFRGRRTRFDGLRPNVFGTRLTVFHGTGDLIGTSETTFREFPRSLTVYPYYP